MGRRPKGGEAEGDEDPAVVVDQEGWKEQKAGNVTRSSTEGLRRPRDWKALAGQSVGLEGRLAACTGQDSL